MYCPCTEAGVTRYEAGTRAPDGGSVRGQSKSWLNAGEGVHEERQLPGFR